MAFTIAAAAVQSDTKWQATTNGMTLEVGKQYIIQNGHAVTFPTGSIGDSIAMLPANGNWATLAFTLTEPAGWTIGSGQSNITATGDMVTFAVNSATNWLIATGGVALPPSAEIGVSYQSLPDFAADGAFVAASVDNFNGVRVAQTTADRNVGIPNPSNPAAYKDWTVFNDGNARLKVNFTGEYWIEPKTSQQFIWLAGATRWEIGNSTGPRWARFVTSGTFVSPTDIVFVTGCGGGGGGGAGGGGGNSTGMGGSGAGGGSAAASIRQPINVVRGTQYPVAVGSGGSAGTGQASGQGAPGTSGGPGNTSSIGTVWIAGGGGGGGGGGASGGAGGFGGGGGTGTNAFGGSAGQSGSDGIPGTVNGSVTSGGLAGTGASSPFGGGGGGARSSLGTGGQDGRGAGGYGSGGGGGGGCGRTEVGTPAGGNGAGGAPGFVMIEW